MTEFPKQCAILSDLWMNYREDEGFEDFIEYNDIGLPLAYFASASIVKLEPIAEAYISETFELLIAALNLPSDAEYDTLDLMLEMAKNLDN